MDPPAPPPPCPLYQRLTESLTNQTHHLWDTIDWHEPIATLHDAIQQGCLIVAVSNATVSDAGHGACAWMLWSEHVLWSGAGLIPALSQDMYSGLAEAFGIYMSLQFIIQYISQYPIVYQANSKLTVYCNNKGVIDWLNNTPTIPCPRDMISNDYPIYQETGTSIGQLTPIKLKFIHMEGHLNTKNPIWPLTNAEILNIKCNKHASQHAQMHPPIHNASNPALEYSYPHLWVDNHIMYCHLQHTLQDTATKKDYFQYL